MFKYKYLKYKNKYLILKQNGGGTLRIINNSETEILENIDDDLIKNIPHVSTSNLPPYTITKNGLTYKISNDGIKYTDDYNFELKIEPISNLKIDESRVAPPIVSPDASHIASPIASPIVSPIVSPIAPPVAPPIVASPIVSPIVPIIASPVTSYGNPHTHKQRIEIVGSNYNLSDPDNTDFTRMIKQPQYANTLFIFNDNVNDHDTNISGGGNAAIRSYNRYRKDGGKPLSAGISTGTSVPYKGFASLDEKITAVGSREQMMRAQYAKSLTSQTPSFTARDIIDRDIQEIKDLISKYKYNRVIWSQDKTTGKLGVQLFNPSGDVIDYITDKIKNLDK